MKRFLPIAAMLLPLSAVAAAAQSPADIQQITLPGDTLNGNIATILQSGAANSAAIQQQLSMPGLGGNTATVTQSGSGDQAAVGQYGTGLKSDIVQNGNNLGVDLKQYGNGGGGVTVTQFGNGLPPIVIKKP
jgi:minor curlin subunit